MINERSNGLKAAESIRAAGVGLKTNEEAKARSDQIKAMLANLPTMNKSAMESNRRIIKDKGQNQSSLKNIYSGKTAQNDAVDQLKNDFMDYANRYESMGSISQFGSLILSPEKRSRINCENQSSE